MKFLLFHCLLCLLAAFTAAAPLPILTARFPRISHRSLDSPTSLATRALDFLTAKRSDWSHLFGTSDLEPGAYGDYDGDGEDAIDGES